MVRYQRGDIEAAAALIRALSPQLRRFFLLETVSRREADDLVQDTWLRIHRVRHTYRGGEPLLPWLYAIARRVRVDHYRKYRRGAHRERTLDEASHARSGPQSGPERGWDLETILADLPAPQREVVQMLKVAGMSLEEVARATASSVGSVKQKAHRAYGKLREKLTVFGVSG